MLKISVLALMAAGFVGSVAVAGPLFKSRKEMTHEDLKYFRALKVEIRKLHGRAREKLVCLGCAGRGFNLIQYTVQSSTTRNRILKQQKQTCTRCAGMGLHPHADFKGVLNKYYSRCRDFNEQYPFDAPITTGLEAELLREISRTACERGLNPHFRDIISKPKVQDVAIVGLRVHQVHVIKNQYVAECSVIGASDQVVKLVMEHRDWRAGQLLAAIVERQSEKHYRDLLGFTKSPGYFTPLRIKRLGYEPLLTPTGSAR